MSPQTDLELIEVFRQGKIEGFNELVRRYQQKVYWIARRIVGSHEEADDIVQEVFIRVYNGLTSFRSESGFYTWIYRISVNVALNSLRARKVKQFLRFDELSINPGATMIGPIRRLKRMNTKRCWNRQSNGCRQNKNWFL